MWPIVSAEERRDDMNLSQRKLLAGLAVLRRLA
jgi:hypothetical protein